MSKPTILYFNHTAEVGGASWALLQLVDEVKARYRVVVALSTPGPLEREFRRAGVDVGVYPALTNLPNPIRRPPLWRSRRYLVQRHNWRRAVWEAERICRRVNPDLVHLNTMGFMHLAIGVKRAGPIPVVLHIREHWNQRQRDFRNRIRERAFPAIDHVLAITRANAQQFGFPGAWSLARDWADFTGRDGVPPGGARQGIPKDKKILLVMGACMRHKGTLVALQAMRRVKDENVVLLVLGGDAALGTDIRSRVRNALARAGLVAHRVTIRREAERCGGRAVLAPATAQMRAVMEEAIAVISPFTEPHFSKPVIEAGALGKPIIASDFPEIREAVNDGVTGLLVPPGDPSAIARAVDRLCANPEDAKRMGEAGRRLVEEQFSRQASVESILDVYANLGA